MAIAQELLDILVCPLCKTPVKFIEDKSGLKCGPCHRVYPVRDDIPVMLIDEAQIYHVPAGWLEALDARVDGGPIIADYIAGMTDRFAVQEHRRLFSTETMI